jgi:hypothetical protein
LLGTTHRAFTFYLENPISSIETRSAPALLGATHRAFTFYLENPHFLDSENSVHSVESLFPPKSNSWISGFLIPSLDSCDPRDSWVPPLFPSA